MLSSLLQFEYSYQARQRTLLLFAVLFLGLGWLMGARGFTPPNLFLNSPYVLAHNVALLSLSVVFPVLFFTISGLLRDQLYDFEGIFFSTAVTKSGYFWSRLAGVLSMSLLAFSMMLPGMLLGIETAGVEPGRILAGQAWSYIYLWLVFVLPNTVVCTVVIFSAGLFSRNRLVVYAVAIGIYALYWLCAIFLNSPLLAAAQPPDPENMIWAALLDPFGISAFLEQSMFWTAVEKNTQLPTLSGYFLLNRAVWLFFALFLLGYSYLKYNFRPSLRKAKGKILPDVEETTVRPAESPIIQLRLNHWKSFTSILGFELRQLVLSWPFILMMGIWIVIVFTEIYSRINSGGAYNDSLYPTTALLVWLIEDPLPFISLLLILFYAGEVLWRDREQKVDGIIGSTPVRNVALFWARAVTLFCIPILLMVLSVGLAIGFQVAYAHWQFEPWRYLAMFYFSGWPLFFYTTVILLVQLLAPRKYLGMAIAFLFFLLTRPFFASQMGLYHPLLQLGSFPTVAYTDMNGFGDTSRPFHHFALHWTILGAVFVFLSYQLWPRSSESGLIARWQNMRRQWRPWNTGFLAGLGLLFLLSNARIYHELNVVSEYRSPSAQLDYREAYERKYKHLETEHRLFPTAIKQELDLYPDSGKYRVQAHYTVQNKSDTVITQLFVTERQPLLKLQVDGATLLERDTTFGTWLFDLEERLLPGDTLNYQYELLWERQGHQTSRSLLANGTYLLRGEYDPVLNYRPSLEIQDPTERHRRGLPPQEAEAAVEEHINHAEASVGRISFDCVISTVADQTAIAPGALVDQWTNNGRAYFHYQSASPMMPVLSFFSAHYSRRDTIVDGVQLELYYHPRHDYNIAQIEASAIEALAYCESAFGEYPHDHLRIAEIPSHWPFGGQALPGTISMVADRLYLTDLRHSPPFDLVAKRTIHEVAHQWWGGAFLPKNTPGASLIIEGLAKYTEAAVMMKTHGWSAPWQISQTAHDMYFRGRANATEVEPPLYLSEGESYLAYGKSYLTLMAVNELLGPEATGEALKFLVDSFANEIDPTATVFDLLSAFDSKASTTEQQLMDDWFKKRFIYDLTVTEAETQELSDGRYRIRARVSTERSQWRNEGVMEEAKLQEPISIGLFSKHPRIMRAGEAPLYYQMHDFESGDNEIEIILDELPKYLIIDPLGTRPDSKLTDNVWTLD